MEMILIAPFVGYGI